MKAKTSRELATKVFEKHSAAVPTILASPFRMRSIFANYKECLDDVLITASKKRLSSSGDERPAIKSFGSKIKKNHAIRKTHYQARAHE